MATTTNYGWETPDDTDLVKDGALAQRTTANSIDSTLGTALNNKLHAGLVLVKTQTIGTGVTSVTVTNAFSATYDNYKIVMYGSDASSQSELLTIKFNNISGTSYYYGLTYLNLGNGVMGTLYGNGVNTGCVIGLTNTNNGSGFAIDVINPYVTQTSAVIGGGTPADGNAIIGFSGQDRYAASQTGFVIGVGAGTLTGGTIAVYGYAKD